MMKNPLGMIFVAALAASSVQASEIGGVFRELQESFPNSVKFDATLGGSSFEFCPDNTCDLLATKKNINPDVLQDIGYLYTYFFSDYAELEEWRKSARSRLIADSILKKRNRANCIKRSSVKEQARCILQQDIQESEIKFYFVRFDEHKRTQIRVNSPIQ